MKSLAEMVTAQNISGSILELLFAHVETSLKVEVEEETTKQLYVRLCASVS